MGPSDEGARGGRQTQDAGAVGLLEAVAIEVGLIVGAGLFSLTGVAADFAGTGLPLAYVVTFAVVGASLVPTAALGSAFPTTAGNYKYPSRLWSPVAAFIAAWGLAISMFAGGLPVYALGFGQYVNDLGTWMPALGGLDPTLLGVGALTVFFLVNLAGIKLAARVQLLLFFTLITSLLTFVVLGFPAVDAGNFSPPLSTGVGGHLTGAAVLYFVCLGANYVVDLGADVREATVNIPKSFLISVPLVFVLYLLTSVVSVGTVGVPALAGETLSVPAEAALPSAAASYFIVGGALFAIATTINAVFMIAPKYMQALADDRFFPEAVARENDRFGTPHWGLAVVWVLSVASLLSPLPLEQLGALLAMGGILLIIAVMVAAVKFVRGRPDAYSAIGFPISGRVVVACALFATVMNVPLLALLAAQTPLVFAGWLAVTVGGGGVFLRGRVRYFRRRDVDILTVEREF